MPTPLPLSYANVRYWRANDAEPQYSVPVRLTDCSDVVYDNQDTLDRLQSRHRGHHGGLVTAAPGELPHVPVTPDVGNGRIMRFVELRQVRALNDHDEETGRQRGVRSYATEDRYLVAPTVAERTTPSRHICRRRANKPDAVYINVENVPAWRTSARQRTSPGALLEEDAEDYREPASCGGATEQRDQASESGKENAELSREEEHVNADSASRSTVNPDHSEDAVQQTKDSDLHEAGSITQLNKETNNESSSSCQVAPPSSQSQQRVSSDAAPARPLAQIRLADAYLLRMSPPPPSPQADGRRRAAYSDPVRWVSPISADRQRHQVAPSPTTTRHATSGRPNGFRSPTRKESGGGGVRTAAMTCTNEALDEAIQRRNRKCKPSALRRLQAAKAVGCGPETAPAAFSSFEPIFEGVACSLRTRSASLNALAKAHGHTLNF